MARLKSKNGGFTLAEAMLAVVVLGIAASAVLLPFSTGAVVRAQGERMTLGAKLACDMMERIVARDYNEIVSTYDGYIEPAGSVTDADWAVFSGGLYSNYSRQVGCDYVYLPQEKGDLDSRMIKVRVMVYYNGQQMADIERLICKREE